MTKLVRITGSGFAKQGAIAPGHPVEFRHWQEVVDDFDFALESAAHSEEEEAVVDLWLEEPQSFMDKDDPIQRQGALRRATAGMGMARVTDLHRKTAAANWDQDFEEAKEHVASILSKLGNG